MAQRVYLNGRPVHEQAQNELKVSGSLLYGARMDQTWTLDNRDVSEQYLLRLFDSVSEVLLTRL